MISAGKTLWSGLVTSVQPRIRLTRSLEQRSHTLLALQVSGPTRAARAAAP
jgi:hypothetical protein